MEKVMIALPDTREIRSLAQVALQSAKELKIVDNESYELSGEFLTMLKTREKSIEETLNPFVKASYEAWQKALAEKAQHMEPVKEAEKIVKGKMKVYQASVEESIREEEHRLREEARKAEEEEKLRRAEELLAAGRHEDVLLLLESPTEAPPIVLPDSVPKLKKIVTKDIWKAEVIDFSLLVRAIADGKFSINLLEANMTAINGMVRSLDGCIDIPGVKIHKERVISSGRGD